MDFEHLITTGDIKGIDTSKDPDATITALGEPDIFTPAYKSYPTMLVYGDLELRFRNNLLTVVTLTLDEIGCRLPEKVCMHIPKPTDRTIASIQQILQKNDIFWQVDKLMTDEHQKVFITNNGINLVFVNGVLGKIAVIYNES
ncbi:hypothetical protein GC194_14975 [bacterium]|nr:hypothetical protein [bacterium]